ncbi:MAG TPA: cytochrome c [Caldilineae bacterium]|nr:cytochrome c [Caldilineae bacterium]
MRQFSRPFLILSLLLLLALASCAPPDLSNAPAQPLEPTAATQPSTEPATEPAASPTSAPETAQMGQRMGGPGSSMMQFQHAQIPDEYASLTNPVAADADSLARGEKLYAALCASCHGDTGMGEGPAGQALDPPASPIAHTSQMLSDAYLFWRITEGGTSFETAMPAWGDALDEGSRWDVINYTRSLGVDSQRGMGHGQGRGQGQQGRGQGRGQGHGQGRGAGMDEAAHHAEMLAQAIDMGLITEEDAELFLRVHAVLDENYRNNESGMGGMDDAGRQAMQRAMTLQAVSDGYITQADADRFTEIHDALLEAGIMQ